MVALVFNAWLPSQLGKSIKSPDLHLQDDQANKRDEIPRIILDSWRSSLNSITTIFRVPHPTSTVIWTFLLYSFATRVEMLNPQYISLTLSWSLATVHSLLAGNALLSAIILFALPTIRTIYLAPRMSDQQVDLLIVRTSLLLNAMGMAGFGISLPSPLFIAALFLYTSGTGFYDSLTTFGITSLPVNQTPADFLVRCGLVQILAGLVAAPFWSTVFSLCLRSDLLPTGLPFWISAGLFGWTIVLSRSLRGKESDIPLV